MFQIVLPVFNPNIFEFGPIRVRWYSLAYIVGILAAQWTTRYLNRLCELGLDREDFYSDFVLYIMLGVVIGGRLGYVLFYGAGYYLLEHPLEIFALWYGGMSFHGGLAGVLVASLMLCKKYGVDTLRFLDILSVAAPVGLFLGRLANFINLELYGRPTDLPWGMVFPTADDLPRHPSQLYEALLEGLAIFIVMLWLTRKKKLRIRGLNSGIFLLLYSLFRIFVETLREPDFRFSILPSFITIGQLLSIPLLLAGIIILIRLPKNQKP
ncbi:MAG: prolipoprotein diacylglyceryl transferase [Rickettsiales bacterium]|jgi:phosphatidylglycerol:prolipoprotein diacylglycerol transferase|nr:prolipoprotein diacylglyceryl transferase [Rickettsiales bacterium]